ncbi:hypothetical protein NC661_03925 [Aquibacillus koreensis]|uniref:Lipoprotein n=1 Tax=Aquibacillus koreensis TaxID=279446 RepID=A0A9X3WGV8_9BACI|nr:hypothetical protein [Aquibacillus koreensis]MCT2534880.1 hypothetical protein [Aquibacillus koreensis]MDC3419510.1 hypothetical protein [Aquibacillus koreensis]
MEKSIALTLLLFVLFVSGCSEKQELTIEDILLALDNEGIEYNEMSQIPELRSTKENYSYELSEGRLRVHLFSSDEDRKEVQADPYPTAMFATPTATYGLHKVLIFYMQGNDRLVTKLDSAFEDFE